MRKNTKSTWEIVGAIIFFIGVVLTALSITAMPSKPLLLADLEALHDELIWK